MANGGSDEKPRSKVPWLVVAGALGLGLLLSGLLLTKKYFVPDGQLPVEGTTNAIGALPKQLGEREINATVERNRAFIRQKCWEPALEGRSKPGRAQARVEASLTVAPTGAVESVSAAQDESFPGLSDCIQTAVKNWKFPQARDKTTVEVPFVFAGQ